MFCKKCGKEVKDGAGFCPKCGEKVNAVSGQAQAPAAMGAGMAWTGASAVPVQTQKKPGLTDEQKKGIVIAAGAAVVALVLILLVVRLLRGGNESYSLVGTWNSEDAVNLEKAIANLLSEEAELDDWAIDGIMEMTGLSSLGDVTVTFDEDGSLWIGGEDISFTIGVFSYQKINKNTLMLKLTLDVPVVGELSASYRAKYSLGKDSLTLDLFGAKAEFTRQE